MRYPVGILSGVQEFGERFAIDSALAKGAVHGILLDPEMLKMFSPAIVAKLIISFLQPFDVQLVGDDMDRLALQRSGRQLSSEWSSRAQLEPSSFYDVKALVDRGGPKKNLSLTLSSVGPHNWPLEGGWGLREAQDMTDTQILTFPLEDLRPWWSSPAEREVAYTVLGTLATTNWYAPTSLERGRLLPVVAPTVDLVVQ